METFLIIAIVIVCICISISISLGVAFTSSSSESHSGESESTTTESGSNTSDKKSNSSSGSSGSSGSNSTVTKSIFKVVGSSDTNFDDEGGGNLIYLDRHNVNCNQNAIKRFHLTRDGSGKFKYEVTCSSGDLGSSTNKDTGANDWGGGNSIYLDRHNIDCGSNSVLTQFHLSRPQGDQIRYDYTCKQSNKPVTCRNVSTGANDWGGGNTIYFDRHDINCNDDEVLSQVHLNRPSENQIAFDYKCCKY